MGGFAKDQNRWQTASLATRKQESHFPSWDSVLILTFSMNLAERSCDCPSLTKPLSFCDNCSTELVRRVAIVSSSCRESSTFSIAFVSWPNTDSSFTFLTDVIPWASADFCTSVMISVVSWAAMGLSSFLTAINSFSSTAWTIPWRELLCFFSSVVALLLVAVLTVALTKASWIAPVKLLEVPPSSLEVGSPSRLLSPAPLTSRIHVSNPAPER